MKKALGAIILASMVAMTGCSFNTPIQAVQGQISDATKVGRAKCGIILGLFRTGDCSIMTAARQGGINEVIVVDSVDSNYIFYISNETVVYGK